MRNTELQFRKESENTPDPYVPLMNKSGARLIFGEKAAYVR